MSVAWAWHASSRTGKQIPPMGSGIVPGFHRSPVSISTQPQCFRIIAVVTNSFSIKRIFTGTFRQDVLYRFAYAWRLFASQSYVSSCFIAFITALLYAWLSESLVVNNRMCSVIQCAVDSLTSTRRLTTSRTHDFSEMYVLPTSGCLLTRILSRSPYSY